MPDILQSVAGGTREAKVEWGGQVFLVEWTPNKMTGVALQEVTENRTVGAVATLLSEVVESWDATAGGEPIPTTPEGFLSVPIMLVQAIFSALNEETTPSGEASGSFAST